MASSIYINSVRTDSVKFADNVENTIVCNKLREDFLGMSTLFLGKEEILCEHNESNSVKLDVEIGNKKFSSVPFKVIIEENGDPSIIVNRAKLGSPSKIQREIEIVEQEPINEPQLLREEVVDNNDNLIVEIRKKENNIKQLNEEVLKYREKLKKEKTINEKRVFSIIDEKVNTSINEFKNKTKELLQNYISNVDTTDRQIKSQIKQQLEALREKLLNPNTYEGNKLILDAIKNIIEEAETPAGGTLSKFRDKLLEDIRNASEQQLRNHTRQMQRYAEMVSGGGSVATQFSDGGTMRGDLNVQASILSGGRDLIDIFSPSIEFLPTNNQTLIAKNNKEFFEAVNQSVNFLFQDFTPGKTIVLTLSGTHTQEEVRHFFPSPTYITGNNAIANTVFTYKNKTTRVRITNVGGTFLGISEEIDTTASQVFRPNGNVLINENGTFLLYESGEAIFLE